MASRSGSKTASKDSNDLSLDAQTLYALGLLQGDGSKGLTSAYMHSRPTRIQGFVLDLRLMGKEQDSDNFSYRSGDANFSDYHGCSSYVQQKMAYAKKHPELNWIGSDNKFNPMGYLAAQDYAKIMLTALGYEYNVDFNWLNEAQFAERLGLTIPIDGNFDLAALATMTVEALAMTMKDSDQTLADYLASVNPDFAAKLAALINGTTPGTTDTTKPTVTSVVLAANGQVAVSFSEAMKADTVKNLANYAIDLDGSLGTYTSTPLSQMTGAAAVPAADLKSVTLTIPHNVLNGGTAAGAGVTNITFSGLADQAGNVLEPVTCFVQGTSASTPLTVLTAAALDVNKLQVTFSNPMKTIDSTEFRLYRADGVTLASVGTSYVLDTTGKVVTITLGGSLTASAMASDTDTAPAKLAISATKTKDIYGNAVSGAVAVPVVSSATPATVTIHDGIVPAVASLVKGTDPYTVVVTFTEPVGAADAAAISSAFRITDAYGMPLTATYTFSGARGTVGSFTTLTAAISGATDGTYGAELLGQGIKDAAGNVVKAYAKTAVDF
ncbi:hypothetical protein [Sporobacter termitidis]|uniref:hypothetical protein n=1 Tax=Sporobacter termitidis TaxID=44749 RepID=UPI0011605C43|nr:hypothetical protein [Sporobacter termitidis]